MDLTKLVMQAQAGDAGAFSEVTRRFDGLVKKLSFQSHLRSIAEEAQAEGWLAMVEAVKTYRQETGVPVAGYIESRVKYALWNLFKRERRRWQMEGPLETGSEDGQPFLARLAEETNVAELVEQQEMGQMALQAVQALPERQRYVVVATLVGEVKLVEAARNLGISVQAAHSLRERGLVNLRRRQGKILAI